jgi:hypothetical protein
MSRGLPVEVFENAAKAVSAPHFAGIDRPGADRGQPTQRRGKAEATEIGLFG